MHQFFAKKVRINCRILERSPFLLTRLDIREDSNPQVSALSPALSWPPTSTFALHTDWLGYRDMRLVWQFHTFFGTKMTGHEALLMANACTRYQKLLFVSWLWKANIINNSTYEVFFPSSCALNKDQISSSRATRVLLGVPQTKKVYRGLPAPNFSNFPFRTCTMMLLAVGVRDTTMATNHLPVMAGPGMRRETSMLILFISCGASVRKSPKWSWEGHSRSN